jgi:ceramide glucosyltransferase
VIRYLFHAAQSIKPFHCNTMTAKVNETLHQGAETESRHCHDGVVNVQAMTAPILAAALFAFVTATFHVASIVIAIIRFRRSEGREPLSRELPPVSLVRPLCGIDNYAADTLRSTFELDYPHYEILFCVASAKDPVVPLVESLIAEHAGASATLLVGDERVSSNPKLNNVRKGWRASAHQWIIIADSNVLMPRDYIQQLFASWRADTGLVASPPIGCRPRGLWAELECAFLNTYQARWQYFADAVGFGFAQGKTMLWRRTDLDRVGGIGALGNEVAEDAAATKIVRGAGRKVRLVNRPVQQPLGRRSAAEVWHRQLRWARLRRASFLFYFLPELFSGLVLPMIAVGVVASALQMPVTLTVAIFAALWYGLEMVLAAVAGWHLSALYPLCGLARDLLLPVLFVSALRGNGFVWRGNEMQVERLHPRGMVALMRPRMQEIAQGSRRRLRALQARTVIRS